MGDVTSILHIGAPKCGSSALQAALSGQPDLNDGAGRRFRYMAFRYDQSGGGRMFRGTSLRVAARMSSYGYLSCPNVPLPQEAEPFWEAARKTRLQGQRRGYVPIFSNEGWLERSPAFMKHFITPETGMTEVVAFVRPPLEWLNAAYWQWIVWGGVSFENWLRNGKAQYRMGPNLEKWAAVPGVNLRVKTAKQDVVAGFGKIYDLSISSGDANNPSAPPALIGFLLRNRDFRPTPHNSAIEFVFQRWCRMETRDRLWAFKPRHLTEFGKTFQREVDSLLEAISPADAEALLQDPRWSSNEPYKSLLHGSMAALDSREALVALDAAIREGVEKCACSVNVAVPDWPGLPRISAPIEAWDEVIAQGLSVLRDKDSLYRQGLLGKSRLGRWALKKNEAAKMSFLASGE